MAPSCGLLLAAVVAIAWPIWRYLHEHSMFTRRAVLAGVTREDSRVRRWLWAGSVVRVLHVFSALAWAAALSAFAHFFSVWHWAVLAVDAVLLAAVAGAVMRRMSGEVRAEHLGPVARRWPLAIGNIALLALAFFAIDFVLGAPDTRTQAWESVARNAFKAGMDATGCAALGWAVGLVSAIDGLAWHAAEVLIPSLPHPALKAVAWLVFLLQAGIVAVAYTRALLGIGAMADKANRLSSRHFFITAFALAVLGIAVSGALRTVDLSRAADSLLLATNPCRLDPALAQATRQRLGAELAAATAAERQRAARRSAEVVDAVYVDVEKGVDAYLDWYFSVRGEYERLFALLGSRFPEKMADEFRQRILGERFSEELSRASAQLSAETADRIRRVGHDIGVRVRREAAARPCLIPAVDFPRLAQVDRDATRASVAVAAGAVIGLASARILARESAALAATRMASASSARAATKLAGQSTGKRAAGAVTAGGAAAAACGPLAPVCALVAAGLTWVALDYAMMWMYEQYSRDDMRLEILDAVRAQKAAHVAALAQQQQAAVDGAMSQIAASLDGVFVPVRQGL